MPRRRVEQHSEETAAKLALRRARLSRAPIIERMVAVVAEAAGVTFDQMLAESRSIAPIARARQIAMYLACTRYELRHSDAGRLLGRDRTTVSHACQLIESLRDEDAEVTRLVDGIEARLEDNGSAERGRNAA